jgi:hypothetical protein
MAFGLAGSGGAAARVRDPQRIKHIVVLFQENHSFNDLLGKLCVEEQDRCEGTTTGVISDGTTIPLGSERDIVPWMGHLYADQVAAMNHGDMNGWDHVRGCGPPHYHCLVQADARRVPTLWSLADNERAIRAYRHCGFREEARLADRSWKDGRWVDRVVMTVTREAFLAAREGRDQA